MAETTELLYFDDTFRFECAAAVRSVEPHGDPVDGAPRRYAVVLDRTVAYPAGGGQPSDTGRLVNGDVVFSIDSVVAGKEDGVVRHVGAFEEGAAPFAVGDEVTVKVDQDARVLHARVHSAGHLLDVAMANVGYPSSILAPRTNSIVSTFSVVAPPPTSKKFAGSAPYSLMMSIVAIAKPAPLTMHPMFPSKLM